MAVVDLTCAALAWASPWIGYAAALISVSPFLLLPSPPDIEQALGRQAG
jgi:hypothetical protein